MMTEYITFESNEYHDRVRSIYERLCKSAINITWAYHRKEKPLEMVDAMDYETAINNININIGAVRDMYPKHDARRGMIVPVIQEKLIEDVNKRLEELKTEFY